MAMRVDTCASALGVPVPPVTVNFGHWEPSVGAWGALVNTWPGKVPQVESWLAAWDPVFLKASAGLTPKSLIVEFKRLEAPWGSFLGTVRLDHFLVTTSGTLSLVVYDEPARIEEFLAGLHESLGEGGARVRVREFVGTVDPMKDLLTPHQIEAVLTAVTLGYYDHPRQVSLRGLSKRLDRSLGTASELIRRAEAGIVHATVDRLTAMCGMERETMEVVDPDRPG